MEVLVAVVILTLGITLCVRAFSRAARSLDEMELGLRAALFLSELTRADAPSSGAQLRDAGPGKLGAYRTAAGEPAVRYEPPGDGGAGVYGRPRTWKLGAPP